MGDCASAVLTGARLSELAQLRLSDVRTDRVSGVVFFDINDESGKKLKTKSAKRQVPLHPVLNQIAFQEYVATRSAEAASEAAGALRLGLALGSWSPTQRRAGELVGIGDIP